MEQLQIDQEIASAVNLVGSRSKSKTLRRFQAWHYLIPIFIVFWMLFAILLLTEDLLFLVVLAILVPLSGLVIGLAWAFQNNI